MPATCVSKATEWYARQCVRAPSACRKRHAEEAAVPAIWPPVVRRFAIEAGPYLRPGTEFDDWLRNNPEALAVTRCLQFKHFGVARSERHQLRVTSLFGNSAAFKDYNSVRHANSG